MIKYLAPLVAALFMSGEAAAHPLPCQPYDQATVFLGGQYREYPIGVGIVPNGSLIELWISESGSWTALIHTPQGMACILASGDDWETVDYPIGEES